MRHDGVSVCPNRGLDIQVAIQPAELRGILFVAGELLHFFLRQDSHGWGARLARLIAISAEYLDALTVRPKVLGEHLPNSWELLFTRTAPTMHSPLLVRLAAEWAMPVFVMLYVPGASAEQLAQGVEVALQVPSSPGIVHRVVHSTDGAVET